MNPSVSKANYCTLKISLVPLLCIPESVSLSLPCHYHHWSIRACTRTCPVLESHVWFLFRTQAGLNALYLCFCPVSCTQTCLPCILYLNDVFDAVFCTRICLKCSMPRDPDVSKTPSMYIAPERCFRCRVLYLDSSKNVQPRMMRPLSCIHMCLK